jgi:GR25 family glycosyltransferase involved in LPS biosynthesis
MWKKAIAGCALSHLGLWWKLANETQEIDSYLILEDDVKFAPGWEAKWKRALPNVPEDADIIYLGGVLPPNRGGWEEECKEEFNDSFSRVKLNKIWNQTEPNRYFHFCTYAYVLTRRGAQKILDFMRSKDGCWSSADHMMCNIPNILNIYFLYPLIAGCYQDDDPVYQNSQFNDFSRVDKFDSDLWNNTEKFEDVKVDMSLPLDILGALEDARKVVDTTEVKADLPRRIVSFFPTDLSKWYETEWLSEMGLPILKVELLDPSAAPPTDSPIVFVQRPNLELVRNTLEKWNDLGVKFYVLHLSDEFGADDISMYAHPSIARVLRNYWLPTLAAFGEKVFVLPLGYANGHACHSDTPTYTERKYLWGFAGSLDRQGRNEALTILRSIGPYQERSKGQWSDPNQVEGNAYVDVLKGCKFVPCFRGSKALESFRIYEALEAGAIPVYVPSESSLCADEFKEIFGSHPFLGFPSWENVAEILPKLVTQTELMETQRKSLMQWWKAKKEEIRKRIDALV